MRLATWLLIFFSRCSPSDGGVTDDECRFITRNRDSLCYRRHVPGPKAFCKGDVWCTYAWCCKNGYPELPSEAAIETALATAALNAPQWIGSMRALLHYVEGMWVEETPVKWFLQNDGSVDEESKWYSRLSPTDRRVQGALCALGLLRACIGERTLVPSSETLRRFDALIVMYMNLFHRCAQVFRIFIGVLDCEAYDTCEEGRGPAIAEELARSLEFHDDVLAEVVDSLRDNQPSLFLLRLGTLRSAIIERVTSEKLRQLWQRAIEALSVGITPWGTGSLLRLATFLRHTAMHMMAHGYAQLLLADMSPDLWVGKAVSSVPGSMPRFLYHPYCCARYHVVLELLRLFNRSDLLMVEIGVHRALVAQYVLPKLPELRYVGVDSFASPWHDHLYPEAMAKLHPFGDRARLVRRDSAIAWNTSGSLEGLEVESVDLLFVDGDHSYEAAKMDISSWSRFVRPGGFVAGHDFLHPGLHGVAEAVLHLRGPNEEINLASDYVFWWPKD